MNDQISSRIPSLLEPYLALLPESSLILLTGVLGATTNWLVLRYLYACLRGTTSLATRRSLAVGGTGGTQEGPQQEEEEVGVVLVSFLRDGSFWREGAGKLVSYSGRCHCLPRAQTWTESLRVFPGTRPGWGDEEREIRLS